jgi:copper(I)-binding protein
MKTPIKIGGSLLAALFFALPTFADPAADTVDVGDPYARAVPEMMKNSAIFMSLTNTGSTDQAVVGASSPAAEVVELHTHEKDGDVMRMRKIDQIAIKAGETTILEPGGLHIMLLGLTEPLSPGAEVDLEMRFSDGTKKNIVAPVKSVQGMQHGHGAHHH